jgi:hypothetical protein
LASSLGEARRPFKAAPIRCNNNAPAATIDRSKALQSSPLHTNASGFAIRAPRRIFSPGAGEFAMAKGQMRSNKEKKKPKADKNLKKGGVAPVNPFASGKTPAGQSPNSKKN